MDNITLNGFEVFEDLMPGASVKNKPITPPTSEEEEETKIDLEGVGEELSEEELDNIRKNTKTETEEKEEPEEEDKEVKSKPKAKPKTTTKEEVEEILSHLNEKDRELFVKHYLEDIDLETIALKSNTKVSNLYNRLSRGRKRIRENMCK